MPTDCNPHLFGFAPVEGRRVEAAFDGGAVTSDAGALLLGATDRANGLIERFAQCFTDSRCLRMNLVAANSRSVGNVKYLLRLYGEDVLVAEVLYREAGSPTYVWHGEPALGFVVSREAT
jgi:hypothetical protein